MELLLKRKYLKQYYTIGHLFVDGQFYCDTLEDTVRRDGIKVKGSTAIPAGTYNVIWAYSPRFRKWLPRLQNVPHFEGILIHSGNTHRDTEGCILVGKNDKPGRLSNSRNYSDVLNRMIELASNEKKEIKIKIVYA
jgi:hypothetical protein